MQPSNIQQITKEIKKSLLAFDLNNGITHSNNEAQTRTYLVEPFLKILRFSSDNKNLVPEFNADFANLKKEKADYAILLKNKSEIIVEVKKANSKLSQKELSQLNGYFNNTNDSKIGILTNGIEYQFYCQNNNGGKGLHPTPFYVFNWANIEGSSLEKLAEFYATLIDIKKIVESAQESFFLEGFQEALFKELCDPSKDFIKAIFAHMNGKKLTEGIEKQIKKLINSVSLKSAIDRLIVEESNKINSGIITTEDELKFFHIIKTILAPHKQIDTNLIGYRDFKGKFSVLFDNNQKKKICDLYITPSHKKIDIDGEVIEFKDVDDIIKLKKKLTNKTLSFVTSTT